MLKNQEVKRKVARTNFLILGMILFFSETSRSADLGAGYSKNSNGSIQKSYNLGMGLTKKISLALYSATSLQKSEDSTVDNKSSSYKGTIIYKPDQSFRLSVGYKKIDDYNEYAGAAYSVKVSVKSNPPSSDYFGSTKLSLGVQDDRMKYEKNENEQYEKQAIIIGLSQEFVTHFTIGVDWSKYSYLPSGTSTVSALKGKIISDDNIADTVDCFTDQSAGAYIEYNDLSFWSLGIGYSQSKDYQDKDDVSKSYETYADVEVGESITLSPSYTTTKSKTSSTPRTNSVALNININF